VRQQQSMLRLMPRDNHAEPLQHQSYHLPLSPQILDHYFGNVCELDLVFGFHKVYCILDEFIIGGEIQETSKKVGKANKSPHGRDNPCAVQDGQPSSPAGVVRKGVSKKSLHMPRVRCCRSSWSGSRSWIRWKRSQVNMLERAGAF
jgi:hypothetical protein